MCLIIDACGASHGVWTSNPAAQAIRNWIFKRDGVVVTGGKLSEELAKIESVQRFLQEASRLGRHKTWPSDAVAVESKAVESGCKSNDAHVVALGRLSRARVLWTDDKELMVDWKNLELLPSPRGSIFADAKRHVHLLVHKKGCERVSPCSPVS